MTQAQRHGFRGRRDVYPGQKLVDDLDLAAVSGRCPQPVHFRGHRIQRFAHLAVGLGMAGSHHGDLALGRSRRPSGNRCVEIENIFLGQALFQSHRPAGIDGGTHHENASRLHRRRCTVFSKQNGFRLRSVDDDADQYVAGGGQLRRAVAGHSTFCGKRLHDVVAKVEHVDAVSCALQRFRHAQAHGSQAHDSNFPLIHLNPS